MITIATYIISDIHGEYDKFIELLDIIRFQDSDMLYVLGDVFDRGPHPVMTMLKLMEMPNVICLVGNHELMALECLGFLLQEITVDSIETLDNETINNIITWQYNGCQTTTKEFSRLDTEMRHEVIDFIRDFSLYEEITVAGKKYLLVHAGLGNFSPEKSIDDYSLYDLVWERPDYDRQYFDDVYVVSGHTPTQTIKINPKPGYIFKHKNHIAIDCGACFPGGRLAAICLDTGEEFYSSSTPEY